MAQMNIPILVNWDDIKDHMAKSDIVEVVRCKDCKYNCFNAEAGIAKCCMFHAKTNLFGFCYLGERRTDGEIH